MDIPVSVLCLLQISSDFYQDKTTHHHLIGNRSLQNGFIVRNESLLPRVSWRARVRENNTLTKYLQKLLRTPLKFDEQVLKITIKVRRKIKPKPLSHFCTVNNHSHIIIYSNVQVNIITKLLKLCSKGWLSLHHLKFEVYSKHTALLKTTNKSYLLLCYQSLKLVKKMNSAL